MVEPFIARGPIESGGFGFWCEQCRVGKSATTGIHKVDEQNIDTLIAWHLMDEHKDLVPE